MKLVYSFLEHPIGVFNKIHIGADATQSGRVMFDLPMEIDEHHWREFKAQVKNVLDAMKLTGRGVNIVVRRDDGFPQIGREREMWKQLPYLALAAGVAAVYELHCPAIVRAPVTIPALYMNGYGHPPAIRECNSTGAALAVQGRETSPVYWPGPNSQLEDVLTWLSQVWRHEPSHSEVWPDGLRHKWKFSHNMGLNEIGKLPVSVLPDLLMRERRLGAFSKYSHEQLQRPLRRPHFTVSESGFTGTPAAYGELDLAHHGLLVISEPGEWTRRQLEVLEYTLKRGVTPVGRKSVFRVLVLDSPHRHDPLAPRWVETRASRLSPLADALGLLHVLLPGVDKEIEHESEPRVF